jgi:hypothetical protein
VTFDLDRPAATAAAEAYLALPRPLFTKVPVAYRLVPLRVRTTILAAMAMARTARPAFPSWPIEMTVDAGVDPPLYRGRRAAFVLTHDIDSAPELRLVEATRAREREIGIISSFGFVPELSWPTETLARNLVAEGCEIYWHDIAHNGRLPYLRRSEIRSAFTSVDRRWPWATELITTFRSGQLLASPALLEAVADRFSIDMSLPDTERDGPYGSAAGCGTIFPFRLRGLVEVPLTMPQDVFMRHVYRLAPTEILATWRRKLDHIRTSGGVAVLNIHPIWIAGDVPFAEVVEQLLRDVVASDDFLVATPSGLVRTLRE